MTSGWGCGFSGLFLHLSPQEPFSIRPSPWATIYYHSLRMVLSERYPQDRGPCAQWHHALHFYKCPEDLWLCFPFYCICIGVFSTYMSMYYMCAVTREPRKGIGLPKTGVTDSCEPPCICREMNPGPLKSNQCSAELFLQLFQGVLFLNLH